MKRQKKPGTPGGQENKACLAGKLIQGPANSPGVSVSTSSVLQSVLRHGRFLSAKARCLSRVTASKPWSIRTAVLSAPRQKSGFQLEMVVNLEPGKEHKASIGGTPCGGWGAGKGTCTLWPHRPRAGFLGLCWVFSREEPLEASRTGLTCWQSTRCQRAPGEPR